MVKVKALDKVTPAELWREVPWEEEFWRAARERQRQAMKLLLQGALETEMVQLLAAARYRRTEVRQGYRNGHYERDLATQMGVLSGIQVPRARGPLGERQVFRAYQRRQALVDALVRDVFLAGSSSRRVGAVLESLLGEPVSAQTVSRIVRSLDGEVARFQQEPLADDFRYLLLDGVSMRVKGALEVNAGSCCAPLASPGRARAGWWRSSSREPRPRAPGKAASTGSENGGSAGAGSS